MFGLAFVLGVLKLFCQFGILISNTAGTAGYLNIGCLAFRTCPSAALGRFLTEHSRCCSAEALDNMAHSEPELPDSEDEDQGRQSASEEEAGAWYIQARSSYKCRLRGLFASGGACMLLRSSKISMASA